MKNIFENAYFGKTYKTRDGRKAVLITYNQRNKQSPYVCAISCYFDESIKSVCHNFYPNGKLHDNIETVHDIVSEWQEPIVCACNWKDYYDYRIMMPAGEAHVRVSFFKDEIIISDLFVDEKYRNKGYATILLNKVDELLNGKQATIYPLEPWQKLWYEKRGYIIGKNTEEELDELAM